MENRESSYYRRDGASRPPQQEGAASQRESALFTELPLDSVRRTPNSGRPAPQYSETETANRRSTRPAAEPARTAPRAVPYTPMSLRYSQKVRLKKAMIFSLWFLREFVINRF